MADVVEIAMSGDTTQQGTQPDAPQVDTSNVVINGVPADNLTEENANAKPQETGRLFANKFKTEEALEKGYEDLQREYSKLKNELKKGEQTNGEGTADAPNTNAPSEGTDKLTLETGEQTTEAPVNTDVDTNAESSVESTPLYEQSLQSYTENGGLTDEQYKQWEASGVPKEQVDGYIAFQQQQATNAVQGAVGGAEAYSNLQAWAGANLTDAQKIAYNNVVNNPTTSLEAKTQAVMGLQAMYNQKNPSGGLKGTTTPSAGSGVQPFKSTKEWTHAISQPEYKISQTYREQVQTRMKAGMDAGYI